MSRRQPLLKFLLAVIIAIGFANIPVKAAENDLIERAGPRPQTTNGVPHIQIGVAPAPEIKATLLQRVAGLPGVVVRASIISLPGAQGFWIQEDVPLARADVLIRGREFAHVHPDGSLHASLEHQRAVEAVRAGWAVFHPWADQREGWDGFVMLYTPTNPVELDVVFQLVTDSYTFVTGRKVPASDGAAGQ